MNNTLKRQHRMKASRKARQWDGPGSMTGFNHIAPPVYTFADRHAHIKEWNQYDHLTLMKYNERIARIYLKKPYGDLSLSPNVNRERLEALYPECIWRCSYDFAMLDLSYNRNTDVLRYETTPWNLLVDSKDNPVAVIGKRERLYLLELKAEHAVVQRAGAPVESISYFGNSKTAISYHRFYYLKTIMV